MTPKAQRIGIIVIAVVLIAGTLGSFAMMILATENQKTDEEKAQLQYQEMVEEQQKKAEELSSKYYDEFKKHESRPAAFDASTVGEEVTFTDIKKGDGETITEGFTDYQAYYIGWNPSGTIFDGSISEDSLKPPLDLSQMTLIPGWYDGVEGMKIGGVREITIPAALAYGERGQGENIPANTPIKFLIMAIPAAE